MRSISWLSWTLGLWLFCLFCFPPGILNAIISWSSKAMLYFRIPDQFCLACKYDIQNISFMCDHLGQMHQKVVTCVLQKPGFLVPWCIVPEENTGMVKKGFIYFLIRTLVAGAHCNAASVGLPCNADPQSPSELNVQLILLCSHKGQLPLLTLPGQGCHS